MTKGQYMLQGKTYHMDIHGFAKDMIFKAEQISDSHIVFSITHTEDIYSQYPFRFCFSVIYKLEGSKLIITYYVRNNDEKTMFFGVGGHPGFNVPFKDNMDFEDYYLEEAGRKERASCIIHIMTLRNLMYKNTTGGVYDDKSY